MVFGMICLPFDDAFFFCSFCSHLSEQHICVWHCNEVIIMISFHNISGCMGASEIERESEKEMSSS